MTVGFAMVRSSREDVRATQIMLQKMETLRLYTWSQLQDNTYLVPNFTERFNPSATNGTLYYGTIAVEHAYCRPAFGLFELDPDCDCHC